MDQKNTNRGKITSLRGPGTGRCDPQGGDVGVLQEEMMCELRPRGVGQGEGAVGRATVEGVRPEGTCGPLALKGQFGAHDGG